MRTALQPLFMLLLLLCGGSVAGFPLVSNQAFTWTVYAAADNGPSKIRIKDEGFGIAEIQLLESAEKGWEQTEIVSIDIIQEYVQVKSRLTAKKYELFIDWQLGKIVLVNEAKKECAFWKT